MTYDDIIGANFNDDELVELRKVEISATFHREVAVYRGHLDKWLDHLLSQGAAAPSIIQALKDTADDLDKALGGTDED